MRISDWSSDVCSSDLALTATPLGNGESKAGCGGISIFIQVMTVKRQSRLQSPAITRTKTDRLSLFQGAQFIAKSRVGFGRQSDFKAIRTDAPRCGKEVCLPVGSRGVPVH